MNTPAEAGALEERLRTVADSRARDREEGYDLCCHCGWDWGSGHDSDCVAQTATNALAEIASLRSRLALVSRQSDADWKRARKAEAESCRLRSALAAAEERAERAEREREEMGTTTKIEIQEWDDGDAVVFAEGEHTPEDFQAALLDYFGYDPLEEWDRTLADVTHGEFYRLDTPPDGYSAYYFRSSADADERPGRMVRGTYLPA